MSNWKLGDRVHVSHRLNKQGWDPETYERFAALGRYEAHGEKRWVPVPFAREGVVVGQRVVQNNWVDTTGDVRYAVPTKYITAYLVSYDMRANPVYVLPEHMVRVP